MKKIDASTQSLAVTGEARESALLVKLSGELDLAGATVMRQLTAWVDAQPDPSPLVLDLSELGFVDSSGLRMLLETTVGERPVALLAPSAPVARLLELTGLTERFTEVASIDARALQELRTGQSR